MPLSTVANDFKCNKLSLGWKDNKPKKKKNDILTRGKGQTNLWSIWKCFKTSLSELIENV